MKRVEQTRTGADGNCLNACVASILELPLKAVPEFGDDWLGDLNDFLAERGLSYRRVPIDGAKPSGWGTIEGVSPRGGLHACVALDGELVWDPHPVSMRDGQGLVEPRYYGLIEKVGRARDAKETTMGGWLEVVQTPHGSVELRKVKPITRGQYTAYWVRGPKGEKRFTSSVAASGPVDGEQKARLYISKTYGAKATDRADMTELRRNTERQGGPFDIQETERDGSTRVVPVKNLAKGADASLTSWAALLLAIYAAYRLREEKPETYDLTKYRPRRKSLDSAFHKAGFTVASANAALKAAGYSERLVKGPGYYYFSGGGAPGWYESGVYTYSIGNWTAADVIKERNRLANKV